MPDFGALGVTANMALFGCAAIVVWICGTRITATVDAIATRTGLGQPFAGMLLLGGITSLPELSAVVASAATGNAPLAVNNLPGSVSINIVLIAVADAVIGRRAITSKVASASTLMQGTLGIAAKLILVIAILVGDVAVSGVGLWSTTLLAFCIAAFWLSSRYAERTPWQLQGGSDDRSDAQGDPEQGGGSLRRIIVITVLLGVGILCAGFVLSQSADVIAEDTGFGAGLVGLVLVGFATSLPELSTITAAVRRRRYDMALGDIFGTNLLTIALIFAADVAYRDGAILASAGRFEAIAALLGALLAALFVIGLLEREDRTVFRMGYDSLAAIAVFVAGLGILYSVSG
jgi:cation:H+ antiporter